MRIIPDDTIAILNIWIEARGETFEGKVAVGEVMLNRLKKGRWGGTLIEVVLSPYQFSGWNTKERGRIDAMLLDDTHPQYLDCKKAWEIAKTGTTYAKGATLYYNPHIVAAPNWAKPSNLLARIGNHNFYRE